MNEPVKISQVFPHWETMPHTMLLAIVHRGANVTMARYFACRELCYRKAYYELADIVESPQANQEAQFVAFVALTRPHIYNWKPF